MGWWSIGGFPEELMGDSPADAAAAALGKLARVREAKGSARPRFDELLPPLCAALASASKNRIRLGAHKTIEAVVLDMKEARIELRLADAAAPADEVACFTELLREVKSAYATSLDRAPSPRELLHAVSFVARPVPNDLLHPEEARDLSGFEAVLRDDRGVLPEAEIVAAIGAALRRRAGKLGALIQGGESIEVESVVVTPHEGEPVSIALAGLRADPFVVDELSSLLDAIAKHHREESRAEALPQAGELMGDLRRALASQPERYDMRGVKELSLRVVGTAKGKAPSRARVRHPKFGEGTVVREIEGTEKKLEIFFDKGGTRTLLARFVEPIG
jgi:hypothetical protein